MNIIRKRVVAPTRSTGKRLLLLLGMLVGCSAGATELDAFVKLEASYFADSGKFEGQDLHSGSVVFGLELFNEWDQGDQSIVVDVLARKGSSSSSRSLLEIRDLYWSYLARVWDISLGYRKVFWGVTEFSHSVDIINQSDLVDDPFGNEKLGQPMLSFTRGIGNGVIDLYLLLGFQDRTFPGLDARLRPSERILFDQPVYESSTGSSRMDVALRLQQSVGNFEIGVSAFLGTDRTPELIPIVEDENIVSLVPFYGQVHQFGLEFQWNVEDWIFKWEGAYRDKNEGISAIDASNYWVYAGGLEYSFYEVFKSKADLNLFLEYSADSRDELSNSPFEHDLFAGFRWTANDNDDTTLLVGAIWDRKQGTTVLNFEGSRRIGRSIRMSVSGDWFGNVGSRDILSTFEQDSNLRISVSYYFGL